MSTERHCIDNGNDNITTSTLTMTSTERTDDTPSTSQTIIRHLPWGTAKREVQSSVERAVKVHCHERDRPVQIIRIDASSKKIVFLEDQFPEIFKKVSSAESRPIAIITIAGPPKSGKSSFLDEVIGHIYVDGPSHRQSLHRFTLESSESSGIWMYPTPLIVKSRRDGSEQVVLVMETRGAFDENYRHQDWEKLLGLSLLTSSCLILNFLNDIEKSKVDILKTFLQFGLSTYREKVIIQDRIHKAYQKLVFLIRDWDKPTEHPYGSGDGGDSFISKTHPATFAELKQCFDEVDCFLIPNKSDSSDPTFTDTIRTAITELLDISKLPSKNIYGNALTGDDLAHLFKEYVTLFNENSRLDEDILYESMFKFCESLIMKKCELVFNKTVEVLERFSKTSFVTDEELNTHYQEAEKSTLKLFDNADKMGSSATAERMAKKLQEQIQINFEPIQFQILVNREQILSDAHYKALSEYKKSMEGLDSVKQQFSHEQLHNLSKASEENAKDLFDSVLNLKDPNGMLSEKEILYKCIEDEFRRITTLYKKRRTEAEKAMENQLKDIVKVYRIDMERLMKGQIPSEYEIRNFHKAVYIKCIETMNNSLSSSPLYEQGQKDLESMLNNQLQMFQEKLKKDEDNMKKECEELLDQAKNSYSDKMTMTSVTMTNKENFEAMHRLAKSDAIKIIDKKLDTIPSNARSQLLEKLESSMEIKKLNLQLEMNSSVMKEAEIAIRDAEIALQNAGEEAKKNYREAMDTFVNQNNRPISVTELVAQHGDEKAKAISKFHKEESISRIKKDLEAALESDLKESIETMFMEYKKQNDLKIQEPTSTSSTTANAQLTQVQSEYMESLQNIIIAATDKDTLIINEKLARAKAVENFDAQLDPETVKIKPEYKTKRMEELTDFMNVHFNECYDDFITKLKEDEIALKVAFDEAKKQYCDEMSKRLKTKNWFEPEELNRINAEVMEITIANIKEDLLLEAHQVKNLRAAIHVLYLKYEEENILKYPVQNPAIGIDLGTTYSCVGVFVNGEVKIIPDRDVEESKTMPSYVAFGEEQSIVVGEAAKQRAFLDPENTIFDAKRLIGRDFNDPIVQKDIKLWPFDVVDDMGNGMPKIKVRGNTYRPEQISAHVIRKMKQIAESYLKTPVKKAVVTVPAYFNDGQRQATRDAAEIAGLEATILNEPTAAALASKLNRTDDHKRNVLVFDLGGGSFDVAVLEMKGMEIRIKAIGGDTHLGGEDFDNNMVTALIERVKQKYRKDLGRDRDSSDEFKKREAAKRLRRMRDQCERGKRNLSSAPTCRIVIDVIDENLNLDEVFTRDEFETLNNEYFQKCISIVKSVLEDAKMEKTEVDDIVLVGGSTRIPKVRELLKQFFDGEKELNWTVTTDEAVACGAAIQAAILHGKQAASMSNAIKLADVTPLSIGVEVITGAMGVIIPKNTPIPCSHTETFQTVVDNQTVVKFNLFEGEKPKAKDNNFLGEFRLTNIPKAPAGKEPLDCIMSITSEGILNYKVVTRSNGLSSGIRIETYNGRMASTEIERAKRDINSSRYQ